MKRLFYISALLLPMVASAQVTVTVEGTEHQTWQGFSLSAQMCHLECDYVTFRHLVEDGEMASLFAIENVRFLRMEWRTASFERADEILYSDYKNNAPTLTFGQLFTAWRSDYTDDDADDLSVTAAGFPGKEMEHRIDSIFVPLYGANVAAGKDLEIIATFVDFDATDVYESDPPNYAEQVVYQLEQIHSRLATHGIDKYVWGLEPWLEPNNGSALTVAAYVANFDTVAVRLWKTFGVDRPRYFAPSTSNAGAAFDTYTGGFSAATTDTLAKPGRGYLSFHLYGSDTEAARLNVASAASSLGIDGCYQGEGDADLITYIDLWYDLGPNEGECTIESLYPIAFNETKAAWNIDETDPSNPVISRGPDLRWISPWNRYVAPGAVVVEMTTSNANVHAMAFHNWDDTWVYVVFNDTGSSQDIALSGINSATYVVAYSTTSADNTSLTGFTGTSATRTIPANGIIAFAYDTAGTWESSGSPPAASMQINTFFHNLPTLFTF